MHKCTHLWLGKREKYGNGNWLRCIKWQKPTHKYTRFGKGLGKDLREREKRFDTFLLPFFNLCLLALFTGFVLRFMARGFGEREARGKLIYVV
jgi:hypothetical protein